MRSIVLLAAALAAGGCVAVPVQPAPAAQAEVSIDVFEVALAEHGQWIDAGRYGRVWRPFRVPAGWQPYYFGEWVWTDDGWLWVTDEPWGWATYHYGRWAFDAGMGWIWVPGYVWGPAWVAWREVDGYVGWAPLYPDFVVWWADPYPVTPNHWIFVPTRSFVGVRVDVVAVPRGRVSDLVRSSRPAQPPARRWLQPAPAPRLGGPSRSTVERGVGRPVPPARMVPVPRPADARRGVERGEVPVYRPAPSPKAAPQPKGDKEDRPRPGDRR